jgi:hypothetical protein
MRAKMISHPFLKIFSDFSGEVWVSQKWGQPKMAISTRKMTINQETWGTLVSDRQITNIIYSTVVTNNGSSINNPFLNGV